MKLIAPNFSIMAASGHDDLPYTYKDSTRLIEAAGRTCYKSEDKIWKICPECSGEKSVNVPDDESGATAHKEPCPICEGGKFKNSAEKFVNMLINRGHLAMLEHSWRIVYKPDCICPSPFLSRNVGGYIAGNARAFQEFITSFWLLPDRTDEVVANNNPTLQESLFACTVRIICDRGVSHELVRHRPASYAQESTRYCDYRGDMQFIIPVWSKCIPVGVFHSPRAAIDFYIKMAGMSDFPDAENCWLNLMWNAENFYKDLRHNGWRPEQARSVLPNSLKTEIVVTASLKEWNHIFKLRTAKAAHPQMRKIMVPLRNELKNRFPNIIH